MCKEFTFFFYEVFLRFLAVAVTLRGYSESRWAEHNNDIHLLLHHHAVDNDNNDDNVGVASVVVVAE